MTLPSRNRKKPVRPSVALVACSHPIVVAARPVPKSSVVSFAICWLALIVRATGLTKPAPASGCPPAP
ncbi:MAG: hypothetical protein DMG07_01770 [Acidobacteria bacterium]|nr:MAG: hypothetical protein DMG07_01770 [Acidobacteriota bacterium]